MSDAILEAINKANETILTEENSQKVETQEKEVESKVEGGDPETEVETKLDQRTIQALQILDLLESPEEAPKFINELARKAGLVNNQSTPKEVKVANKAAADIIKEELGENYSFLSEPLSRAIEKIVGSIQSDYENKLLERDQKQFSRDFEGEFTKVTSELKMTESEASELLTLVNEEPPNPKVPLKTYLERKLLIVRHEQGKVKEAQINKAKVKQKNN